MITDADIREYLLGRLDPDLELVESIDEQILTDPEFSISVDVIEDEIIEEYLEGLLTLEDRRAVERHFLRPPERQRKLKTARLFGYYLEAEPRHVKPKPAPARGLFKMFHIGQMLPRLRMYTEIAASAVFFFSTLILLNQRRELELAVKQTSQQLDQERQRSAVVNQQLRSALQSLRPAIAMLSLVTPGQRGEMHLPEVKISSETKALRVEVALSSGVPRKYRVQLRHAGNVVWSQDEIDATSVPGGAILKVDIPADVLPQGTDELGLTSPGNLPISYWFSISKL